jgi:hypothetical protein
VKSDCVGTHSRSAADCGRSTWRSGIAFVDPEPVAQFVDLIDHFAEWHHVLTSMRRRGVRKALKQKSHRVDPSAVTTPVKPWPSRSLWVVRHAVAASWPVFTVGLIEDGKGRAPDMTGLVAA